MLLETTFPADVYESSITSESFVCGRLLRYLHLMVLKYSGIILKGRHVGRLPFSHDPRMKASVPDI